MIADPVATLTQSQRERLSYVDFCLHFHGVISRSDLEKRFGIAVAAASRDLACYRSLAPDNITYDGSEKIYRIAKGFRPLIPFQLERVLSWLRQGFGDGLALNLDRPIVSDFAESLSPPSIERLGTLARAMASRQTLFIRYLSLSSGESNREIVPLAFVDNGLRWHVRAYDRKNQRFGDFVVNRIASARPGNIPPAEQESLAADAQWHRIVRLEIVPHPGVAHPEAVEADYGMKHGLLVMDTRASLAGYALARWNVDASRDHGLEPARHHLWLRNGMALHDVESATLAPGYRQADWDRD